VEEIAKLAGAIEVEIADQFEEDLRLAGKALQCWTMGVSAPFSCADMCDSQRFHGCSNGLLLSFYFANLLFITFYRYFTAAPAGEEEI
jgi:hypothetical protein